MYYIYVDKFVILLNIDLCFVLQRVHMRNRLPIFSSNRVGKDWLGEGGMFIFEKQLFLYHLTTYHLTSSTRLSRNWRDNSLGNNCYFLLSFLSWIDWNRFKINSQLGAHNYDLIVIYKIVMPNLGQHLHLILK